MDIAVNTLRSRLEDVNIILPDLRHELLCDNDEEIAQRILK